MSSSARSKKGETKDKKMQTKKNTIKARRSKEATPTKSALKKDTA
jgi:hypothetical protein